MDNAYTGIEPFDTSEESILENKKNGVIYVADFASGEGKYISVTDCPDSEGEDIKIKISPKICLRVTYLTNSKKIDGVEISKLSNKRLEKIHFSTLAFERILQLLHVFSNLDLESIANRTLMLDKSIIENPEELKKFLDLVVKDPVGQEKLTEIVRNFNLLQYGDLEDITHRKRAVDRFEKILNDEAEFEKYKNELGVGKDEEVWQRFFKENKWILGAEYVEMLDHRNIDEDDITDYLLQSYDGFVDIVELKLPSSSFWTSDTCPTANLTKATVQCMKYLVEIEKKINDAEYLEKLGGYTLLKPKITLIYGRNIEWNDEEKKMYRVLNSTYQNISILTYDHVLERAKRMVGFVN